MSTGTPSYADCINGGAASAVTPRWKPPFVPQEDCGMGLMDALTHWVVGVQREWIRNLYQTLDHFGTSEEENLGFVHRRWGGCPAVIFPK